MDFTVVKLKMVGKPGFSDTKFGWKWGESGEMERVGRETKHYPYEKKFFGGYKEAMLIWKFSVRLSHSNSNHG